MVKVNHDLLMKFIKQYINDEWLLRMIRKFLTSSIQFVKVFTRFNQGGRIKYDKYLEMKING